jgi:arylsulfatase A-like enzyme
MPFVIRYPKEIPAGTRIDDIILNIDFPALFAEYAGIDIHEFIQGESFRANLKGQTSENWRKTMYYRYWLHQTNRPGHFGIRNKRYKLAFFYGQHLNMKGAHKENTKPAWEFFDLQEDPNELINAYNNPKYRTIISEMKKELKRIKLETGDDDSNFPEMKNIIDQNWEL